MTRASLFVACVLVWACDRPSSGEASTPEGEVNKVAGKFMVEPAGSAAASAPPPRPSVAPALGTNPAASLGRAPEVLGLKLGAPLALVEARLGKCEGRAGVGAATGACVYPRRGVEFGILHEKVERIVVHSAGRTSVLLEGSQAGLRFQAFKGEVGGVELGEPASQLFQRLGPAEQELLPLSFSHKNTADAEPGRLYEYSSRGFSLELQPGAGGELRVVAIHLPIALGRPLKPSAD